VDFDTKATLLKSLAGDFVTIILTEPPDPKNNGINVQDFIRDGLTYIPFFSSMDALKESTKGIDFGRPQYQIDKRLFTEMLYPEQLFVFNPDLPSEIVLTGEEIKTIFPEPFPWNEYLKNNPPSST
jgi:hypothetical protein